MYTQVGIINLALGRIGVKRIASLTENSNQAIVASGIWEYIRDEVLEAKDWKFAKKRKALGKLAETPKSGYDYAYALPSDFLRICKGTEDDPGIYPSGFPYKIETMDVIEGLGNISNFSPSSGYATGAQAKIGTFAELDLGGGKSLFIASPYKQDDSTLVSVSCESNASDALSVTASGNEIVIKLANVTGASNTAALIQTAVRALTSVGGVTVSSWTVMENAAYTASRPTSGIDVDAVPLGNGDKAYTCLETIAASANNSGYFPTDEDYWQEIAPSEALVLVTDYDAVGADEELVATYIRKVANVDQFSPNFINSLAFRLAAEMSLRLTEGLSKFKGMMELYLLSSAKADEVNQSLDYFETVDTWGNESAQWANVVKSGSPQ